MRDPDSIPEDHRRRYRIKLDGYSTDRLLDDLDDMALLAHMGVPQKYRQFAAEASRLPMDPVVESWVGNLPSIFRPQFGSPRPELCGVGLVLYGPSGSRKTTAASALLLRTVRLGIPNADPTSRSRWYGSAMGRYVGWQDASALFREAVSDDAAAYPAYALRKSMEPNGPVLDRGDFLVIDDVSRERRTEFNVGELTRILRHRNENGYPTIITSNHYPSEWAEVYGEVMGAFLVRAFIPVEFRAQGGFTL